MVAEEEEEEGTFLLLLPIIGLLEWRKKREERGEKLRLELSCLPMWV